MCRSNDGCLTYGHGLAALSSCQCQNHHPLGPVRTISISYYRYGFLLVLRELPSTPPRKKRSRRCTESIISRCWFQIMTLCFAALSLQGSTTDTITTQALTVSRYSLGGPLKACTSSALVRDRPSLRASTTSLDVATQNSTTVTNAGSPTSQLLCPAAMASSPYLAPGLQISYSINTESQSTATTIGSHLPIQHYHLKNFPAKARQLQHTQRFTESEVGRIPDLDFVIHNLDEFDLSVSSKSLLQQYREEQASKNATSHTTTNDTTTVDTSFVLNKIRTEHRAAQPLSTDVLQILYCDEHICVVNKPSGVLSVPGHRRNPSMANLVYDTIQPPDIDVDQTVVHRLDMATSGILVFALTLEALSQLHYDFKERRVYKIYQCLVQGHLSITASPEGEIDVALERDPKNPPFMRIAQHRHNTTDDTAMDDGVDSLHKFWKEAPKPSLTHYRILGHEMRQGQPVTRLEMKPLTGRTHQLRVHTAQALGMPIVGDDIYGSDHNLEAVESKLCLHARKLCIFHPISGAHMIFEADPPF